MKGFRIYMVMLMSLSFLSPSKMRAEDSASSTSASTSASTSDRLALTLQDESATQLANLANKYKGTPGELALLLRLIDSQEQLANLEFRLAHSATESNNTRADLARYHKRLTTLRATATRIMDSYPQCSEIPRVLFVRAQAAHELKMTAEAKRDYVTLSERFPKSSYGVRAVLSLAGYATEKNDHAQAISLLRRIVAEPNDVHYPLALHQIAWAYYNFGDIPKALDHLRLHILFYQQRANQSPDRKLSASDEALRDQSLKEVVTFYFEGSEKRLEGYSTQKALDYFRGYTSGAFLGKMIASYAKLLRSRDREQELVQWKEIILQKEANRDESLLVWMTYYEYLLLRQKFDKLPAAANDLYRLKKNNSAQIASFESYPAAVNLLLSSASTIQKLLLTNKTEGNIASLKGSLKAIYSTFISIAEPNDPRIAQVHYNLAEAVFALRDYEAATLEYDWVLANWNANAGLNGVDVALKRISSRYQELLQAGHIPKTLEPTLLEGPLEADVSALPKPAVEWANWIKLIQADANDTNRKLIGSFDFELNRLLYHKKQTIAACQRMMAFVKANPKAETAVAAASLVLDTLLFNQRWEETLATVEQLKQIPGLGNQAFKERLVSLPQDVAYKIMEGTYQAKSFDKTISLAEAYLVQHPKSPRIADALLLGSRAAQQANNGEKAKYFLDTLLTRYPKTEYQGSATLNQATLLEKDYEIDAAAEAYRKYIAGVHKGKILAVPSERETILPRLWFLNWISTAPKEVECSKTFLTPGLFVECDRYQALYFLSASSLSKKQKSFPKKDVLQKALGGYAANRPLWAAVAIKQQLALTSKESLKLATTVVNESKSLDPLIQMTLIPILNRDIPTVFQQVRKGLHKTSPLKADSRAINRRMQYIKELELAAGELVSAPWTLIRHVSLEEVAQAYLDFCDELAKLKVPRGLPQKDRESYLKSIAEIIEPFKSKGTSIRDQAKELASNVPIPQTTSQSERKLANQTGLLDLQFLDQAAHEGVWFRSISASTSETKKPTLPERLKLLWTEAYSQGNWPRMAYFFQEIKDKSNFKSSTFSLMTAVTLYRGNAEVEALNELEATLPQLESAERTFVASTLYEKYARSTASQKASAFKPFEKPKERSPKE